MIDALIIRYYEAEILAALEGSDNFGQAVGQNLRNHALGPLACMALDDHFDHIAQKCIPGVIFPDEDILLFAFYGHEAKAFGMTCIHADDLLNLCFSVASPFGQRDFPFGEKFIQNPVQLLPVFLLHLQNNRQLLLLHGHIARIIDKIIYNFLSLFKCLVCHSSSGFCLKT